MKRIVIYGGTFDPIHTGHIEIIKRLSEKFDKVIVVPTTIRYYKKNDCMYSFNHRFKKVNAAVENLENVEVSDIEREAPTEWRFIDTLRKIASGHIMDELEEYYVAIGSDSFQKFETWSEYEEILKYAKLVVFHRPGYEDNFPNIEHEYISDINIDMSSTKLRAALEEVEETIEDEFETYLSDIGWATDSNGDVYEF